MSMFFYIFLKNYYLSSSSFSFSCSSSGCSGKISFSCSFSGNGGNCSASCSSFFFKFSLNCSLSFMYKSALLKSFPSSKAFISFLVSFLNCPLIPLNKFLNTFLTKSNNLFKSPTLPFLLSSSSSSSKSSSSNSSSSKSSSSNSSSSKSSSSNSSSSNPLHLSLLRLVLLHHMALHLQLHFLPYLFLQQNAHYYFLHYRVLLH